MTNRRFITVFVLVLITLHPLFSAEKDALSAYAAGERAKNLADYFSAIEYFGQALDENSSYAPAMLGLAECYFHLEEYDEALGWIDKTRTYIKNDPDVMNLEARIYIGLGNTKNAADLFSAVLTLEPNNLSALFGYAELEVVSGQIRNAARKYENALRISPENNKALLSLVLIYDSLGDDQKAGYFASRALELHSDSPEAHYIAGRHFFLNGDTQDAEFHIKTALNIDPENRPAKMLLCDLYIETKRYQDAIPVAMSLLEKNRRDPQIWYILGIASWHLGEYEEGRYYLNEAVHLQPDDDLARIAMEQLLIDEFPLEDDNRRTAAAYHFELGRGFSEKNIMRSSLREYRRGLMLDPYSTDGRFDYGIIFRNAGIVSKYVSILDVLIREKAERLDILDEYEIYSSLLTDSVSSRWDVDQFTFQRDLYIISLFYTPEHRGTDHPEAESILARYFHDMLYAHEAIQPLDAVAINGYAEAFRTARQDGSEFFIILRISEIDRIVSLHLDMYNSQTGTMVYTTSILRTGNGRIPEAYSEASQRISEFLLPRGRLLERSFNRGLIDLGTAHGIAEGNTLQIVRRGSIRLAADGPGFEYGESDLLGEFNVTSVDYLVSEGTITKKAFFDMINQHDHVIPKVEDSGEQGKTGEGDEIPLDLYRMLLRIP